MPGSSVAPLPTVETNIGSEATKHRRPSQTRHFYPASAPKRQQFVTPRWASVSSTAGTPRRAATATTGPLAKPPPPTATSGRVSLRIRRTRGTDSASRRRVRRIGAHVDAPLEPRELERVGGVLLADALDLRRRGHDDDARAAGLRLSRDGESRLQVPAGPSRRQKHGRAAEG